MYNFQELIYLSIYISFILRDMGSVILYGEVYANERLVERNLRYLRRAKAVAGRARGRMIVLKIVRRRAAVKTYVCQRLS